MTKERVLGARDYLPLAEKNAWVGHAAERCFSALKIEAQGNAMPDMYMPNQAKKSRYLLGALAGNYLGLKESDGAAFEETDDALLTEESYDLLAGSHLLNQLERWKSDAEARNKCFDLISDFRELEKRLNAEISSLLSVQNDTVIRQSMATEADMKQIPEILEKLKELREARIGAETADQK